MIVVDTSAWVEFLRRTGSSTHLRLRELIDSEANLALTEVIIMELLGGALSGRPALRTRLLAYPVIPLQGLRDYEEAALIYNRCVRGGESLSSGYLDCLIAAPALRVGAQVFHNDKDYDVIARYSDLELAV